MLPHAAASADDKLAIGTANMYAAVATANTRTSFDLNKKKADSLTADKACSMYSVGVVVLLIKLGLTN